MRKSKSIIGVCLALVFAAQSIQALEGIPVVPASVMVKDVPKPIGIKKQGKRDVALNKQKGATKKANVKSVNVDKSHTLIMTPGVNQIIPIAIGHPNRIVTPFTNPEVTSTSLSSQGEGSCGDVCIKDNVIYVATNKKSPVTMFITEKGSQAQALSLTMVPRKIPPREVFLKMESGLPFGGGMYANKKAKAWEQSQPYIETIRNVFRNLAKNQVPHGYTIGGIPRDAVEPSCAHPGIEVDFTNGQYVSGHHLTIFVGIATNSSAHDKEFKESLCGNWDVAAVTTWPHKVLRPGQATEIYVALKQKNRVTPTSKRPSLLGGLQ